VTDDCSSGVVDDDCLNTKQTYFDNQVSLQELKFFAVSRVDIVNIPLPVAGTYRSQR